MQRSSISVTTFVILFSILTVLVQFGAYYYFGPAIPVYCLAALVCFLFLHIFLEQTLSYETCFSYSLLNIFISMVIILLSYFGSKDSLLPYKPDLIPFLVLNWIVPLLYCIIRSLMDSSSKYNDFNTFYRNISIVFILFYIYILFHFLFLNNDAFVHSYTETATANFIPFLKIATLIEDYLNGYVSAGVLGSYLLQGTLLFLPYGFYAILLLRYHGRLIRFLTLLALPVLTEIFQKLFLLGKVDIDDILLGLLGGFIGGICYHILNRIYLLYTDEDFLSEQSHYYFSDNSLHF